MSFFSQKLRKASYNGVSFEVTSSSITFGRRTVIHEYPFNDVPYAEDLGRKTRSFSVEGFIVGETYIAKTKRLVAVLEDKSTTDQPGKLIHPWLGTLKVFVDGQPKVTWDNQQRFTKIEISFIESGNLQNPQDKDSWGNKLRNAVDGAISDLVKTFGTTMDEIEDIQATIDEIANGSFQDILGCLEDSNLSKLFDLGDSLSNLADTATNLLSSSPTDFAKSLVSAVGLGSYVNSVRNWRESSKALIDIIKSPTLLKHDDSSSDVAKVSNAITDLTRTLMIANLAGAVSLIGSSIDSDDETIEIYEAKSDIEIRDLRNKTLNLIEAEMIRLGTDDNDQYESLENLYLGVYNTMTNEILEDNELINYEVITPTSALVLAYDHYGNATRADEIAKRNDIINPLFVPVTSIKLSKK